MELLHTPADAQQWSDRQRSRGKRVVLVPTMGALHDGHRSLIERGRDHGDAVVVSIFVNPLQFNRDDDLDRYPRTLDDDLAVCRTCGVDAIYVPATSAMYPDGFQTTVEVVDLSVPFEGAGRPGHFRGVTTVVAKLFLAVRPQVALFGQKDYQQMVIVEQMVRDLDFGVDIIRVPTVRDHDGVALSSRNSRLSPTDRVAARCIPAALHEAHDAFAAGSSPAQVLAAATGVLDAEPAVRREYVVLADATTLEPVEGPWRPDRPAVLLVAVWIGDVRLIDNLVLEAPRPRP
jgi:pantoate--beta-alanine ligase